MNAQSKTSMSLAIIDRRNNRIVSSEPVEDSHNPHILPSSDTVIWHYIRFDFFQTLLQNKAIWLTRLDKQSDKKDGMYSDANTQEWMPVIQKLLKRSGIALQIGKVERPQFEWTNQVLRKRAFIHCWSIRAKESACMWNSFVCGEPRSIALSSTVGSLVMALRGQPVDFFRMLYYTAGGPRPDWSHTAPFTAKDKATYVHERELRVLTMLENTASEDADHKLIPIDLKKLIRKVVIHPASAKDFRLEVRNELKAHGIPVHVAGSQLRVSDLQAMT